MSQPRIVAVTGAFGILGSAVARAAAGQGARVALIDFAKSAPEGLVAACGPDALALSGVDLTDPDGARSAIDEAAARFGGLDALINVAGGFAWQTHADGDPAVWDRLYAMNVRTTANASRAAIPHLRASSAGRIVNVGANGAVKSAAGMGAYAASKAGVHRLTESLAEELKGEVTVNAVLPSIIDTPTNRADMPDADFTRWVRADELAAVILFLASPAASAVTGALIPVTGRV
ncbi:SDR family NAD(P)-dependent oxidoreductase [Phenylobacterium sp.]|uniref:SDR family NAD(P)-dependent oxidoreductase n=1 Tax=Phenylobacterium sp. TaxID=1871053 RepID=UPI00271E40C2|nr:SDR family NAD(P)-dependent oxidoreductase [Phenylobacterium sp.]MDO8322101.1 SDR family NAD(P)-dependent oxidoreductase [Phenylobacterium sp.]MDP3634336.1 SDR family NAD(P)-dependent oxidoreductase [Phenylobacterium sp.]